MMRASSALGRLRAAARQGASSIQSSQRLYITQQPLPVFSCGRVRGFHSSPTLREESKVPLETESSAVHDVKTGIDPEDTGVAFAFE